ncbi:MAG: RT0821/Lpp0805 family surface protein [Pseudomonadota bacterium]
MTAITPELLMRYADGEVTLPERQFIEKHLPADQEAQELLAVFVAQRGRVAAAFSDVDDTPSLRRFEQAIDRAFEQRRHRERQSERHRWVLPLAASFLMMLAGGVFAVFYAEQRIQTETARLLAERALQDAQIRELALQTRVEALERIVSGSSLTWTNDVTGATGTITPLRTYRGPGGQWCREYRETTHKGATEQDHFSIACRTPDGHWRGHGIDSDPRGL